MLTEFSQICLSSNTPSFQIYKMPKFKDDKRAAHANFSSGGAGGGFFIRRVESPGALAVRGVAGKHRRRRFISSSNNKENMPPVWAVKATPSKRRSPLPEWYPRTPLRDITTIAKAIQRSRLRIAAAQQQSQRPEQSPQSVNLTTPAQTEQDVPLSTESSLAVASSSGSTEKESVASSATILAEDNLKLLSTPAESSSKTASKPTDPVVADIVEKKLSSSIEQIEKMVKQNMKREPEAAQPSKRVILRRNLMSMR
ncbi:hypothetical protein EJB05_21591 [Eragrostis curvula]|uniref:Protein POLYCHOME n=1 Tax=Eragrostis curvula TaxID=38414 RepID=A0A5J9V3P7_9POAL|nr:hypothetical protein EJB05_21591 [Eragrostis curvula]